MTTPSYNTLFGTPFYSIPGALYTPTLSGGAYVGSLPRSNLQDRRLRRVARSVDALNQNTRCRLDLKADRQVRVIAIPSAYRGPDAPVSSSGKIRILGVPSTMLFDYEAGMDIVALGGTFTRAPTTNVRAATYIDRNGILKYAGENLALRSDAFDNASWVKTTTTVSANAVANPYDDTVTADTLTASAGNGTVIQDLGVLASAAFVFSVWLKRKTGTGDIMLTLDGGSIWTVKTLTTKWQRFSVTQTLANPDCGIRIFTSGDAVYAWGAQVEHGTTPTGYVPTTSATNSAPRDGHFIGGYRHLLLEDARTNLCLQSENFGTTWSADGTTPSRSAAAHTASGVTLDLLGDTDAAAISGYGQPITFTGDAVKTVSLFIKQGSSASTVIRLRDSTAGANRLLAAITWSGSTPVITMTTGTSYGYVALADGVYRILLATTSVTAANTNTLAIYLATNAAFATATTGTLYVGGVQAENGTFPSSYIPTTSATVTRAAETLTFPYTATPQGMTAYAKFSDLGTGQTNAAAVFDLAIGPPRFRALVSGGVYNVDHHNGTSSVSAAAATSSTFGDTTEIRAVLTAAGAVQVGLSLNGGTEAVSAASGSLTLAVAWSATTLCINGDGASLNRGFAALRSLRIAPDVQTLSYMQAIVYDSGQLNQYPTGATAETIDGMNVDHALVIPSTQTAFRYVSVQVDDESNSAGYIDLPMLVVAGGWQPTINMATGAAIGFDTDASMAKTDGGARIPTERPVFRTPRFTVPRLPESEGMTSAADMIRLCGLTKQLYWFWNPDDTSANYLHRRSMLCTLRQLSPLAMPDALFTEVAFELEEEL